MSPSKPCATSLRSRAELPLEALKMSRGEPVIETIFAGAGEGAGTSYLTSPAASRPRPAWEKRLLDLPGSCDHDPGVDRRRPGAHFSAEPDFVILGRHIVFGLKNPRSGSVTLQAQDSTS